MIFSELYSAYYNAVARILKEACAHPIPKADLRRIVEQEAFGESLLTIEPAILDERWQLLSPDGTTPVEHVPTMPLTLLQRRWLKAISQDPRIRLFSYTGIDDPEVEPLFRQEDIDVFDRYTDGDPFDDEEYIQRFKMILAAIKEKSPLRIEAVSPKGNVNHYIVTPLHLEYSEKDDKFRLFGHGFHYQFVNLARITQCSRYNGKIHYSEKNSNPPQKRVVELELVDERNALERVLMHFAHFEKQAERLDDLHYKILITYSEEDETEMLIRILAFGPVIKVKSPQDFVAQMKDRLKRQKDFQNNMFASFIP